MMGVVAIVSAGLFVIVVIIIAAIVRPTTATADLRDRIARTEISAGMAVIHTAAVVLFVYVVLRLAGADVAGCMIINSELLSVTRRA
jgi:hypothetical protein